MGAIHWRSDFAVNWILESFSARTAPETFPTELATLSRAAAVDAA
jgi:hypothetical protein